MSRVRKLTLVWNKKTIRHFQALFSSTFCSTVSRFLLGDVPGASACALSGSPFLCTGILDPSQVCTRACRCCLLHCKAVDPLPSLPPSCFQFGVGSSGPAAYPGLFVGCMLLNTSPVLWSICSRVRLVLFWHFCFGRDKVCMCVGGCGCGCPPGDAGFELTPGR